MERRPSAVRRTLVPALVLLLVAAAALAACGSSEDPGFDQADPGAVGAGQPFAGRFDDLPLPARSDPIGSRSEQGGVVTQSYEVSGSTREDVMAFYEGALPDLGWEVLKAPKPSGTSTTQAEWTTGDLILRITANGASGLGGDHDPTEAVRTQYSLMLREA